MGYSNGRLEKDILKSKTELLGMSKGEQDIIRLAKIDALKKHPNYKDTYPYPDEDIISFTLRTCAHLVSPPQEERESYEVECVDIRDGILALKDEIQERFYKLRERQ